MENEIGIEEIVADAKFPFDKTSSMKRRTRALFSSVADMLTSDDRFLIYSDDLCRLNAVIALHNNKVHFGSAFPFFFSKAVFRQTVTASAVA